MRPTRRVLISCDDLGEAANLGERFARSLAAEGYTSTLAVSGRASANYSALIPWRGHVHIEAITEDERKERDRSGGLRLVPEGE